MTIVLIEGFDHITNMEQKNWLHSFSGLGEDWNAARNGRYGGKAWDILVESGCIIGACTVYSYFTKMWAVTTYEAIVGIAFYRYGGEWSSDPHRDQAISFVDGSGTAVAALKWDALQRPYVYSPSTALWSTPANFVHQDETWNYYELRVKVNGASGQCELRINGATASDLTETMNFGANPIGGIQIYTYAGSSVFGGFAIDDIYCVDTTTGSAPGNTFLGDSRVETIHPNGVGASTQWDPSSGANWSCVDETQPDGDASVVTTAVAGEIDLYECEDVSIGSGQVWAVQTNFYAKKQDAGTREIAPVVRQGGANYVGTQKALSLGSYVQYSQLWVTDPTGAAWSVAKVNADEFGVKLVT